MKIKGVAWTKSETEIEVEFPLYRKVDRQNYCTWTRVSKDLMQVTVERYNEPGEDYYSYEIGVEKLDSLDINWNRDYIEERDQRLGIGPCASNESEFNSIIAEAIGEFTRWSTQEGQS